MFCFAGALASLGAMISEPNSRATSESVTATENAISAVVKILKYNSSMVDASKVDAILCISLIFLLFR